MKKYDFIIIGGGIAGLATAELLSRDNAKVLILEKNDKLAGELSAQFHEWLHLGSLYSMHNGNNKTLHTLLGGVDDLIKFYSSIPNMNLRSSTRGLEIGKAQNPWFSDLKMTFKFTNKPWNFIWRAITFRSEGMIDTIKNHDWIRRSGAYIRHEYKLKIFKLIGFVFKSQGDYHDVRTPELRINSQRLLSDLYTLCKSNGVDIRTGRQVTLAHKGTIFTIQGETFEGVNLILCVDKGIKDLSHDANKYKELYSPTAVVRVDDDESGLVLDYNFDKCVNLHNKGDGIAQVGGYTYPTREQARGHLNDILKRAKKVFKYKSVIDTYIIHKVEYVPEGKNRNHMYSILQDEKDPTRWVLTPGKFSLAFSMALEFYRQYYNKDPKVYNESDYSHLTYPLIDLIQIRKYREKL